MLQVDKHPVSLGLTVFRQAQKGAEGPRIAKGKQFASISWPIAILQGMAASEALRDNNNRYEFAWPAPPGAACPQSAHGPPQITRSNSTAEPPNPAC